MTETTTIQITTEQRDELAARKTYDDEPLKAVLGRVLAESGDDAADIADAVVSDLRAELPREVADAVEGRLR